MPSKTVIQVSISDFEQLEKFSTWEDFKPEPMLVMDLLGSFYYAKDANLVAHFLEEMQSVMDCFTNACTYFGLTISIKKTKVIYTPTSGDHYVEPDIYTPTSGDHYMEHDIYAPASSDHYMEPDIFVYG